MHLQQQLFFLLNPKHYLLTKSPLTLGIRPITVATIGNVLGSIVNWWLGRLAKKFKDKSWFPVSEDKLLQGEQYYRKYGRFSLLLSWAPFIGDPITIVAGVLREPLWSFITLVLIAKCSRYLFVVSSVSIIFN